MLQTAETRRINLVEGGESDRPVSGGKRLAAHFRIKCPVTRLLLLLGWNTPSLTWVGKKKALRWGFREESWPRTDCPSGRPFHKGRLLMSDPLDSAISRVPHLLTIQI